MRASELKKALMAEGVTFVRNGSNHEIWRKGNEQFLIPYSSRQHAHSIVSKMLKRARAAQSYPVKEAA